MPPAKRASTTSKSKSAAKPATTASKPSTDSSRASKPAARKPAAPSGSRSRTAAAGRPAPRTARSTKATTAATRASRRASAGQASKPAAGEGVISIAEQLAKGAINPKDLVMLTHDRIQETLDDAASRGRVTRKDANELVLELVRRGRAGGDELVTEIETLLKSGRDQLGSATKRAARSEPVDRIVRGADRARRAAGVGSSFPITGYAELNVGQVQTRLKELSRPELRKVLTYERKHANRKSVVGAIEKSL